MKLIEIHIIQSFPATCLNRDDVGAPKSVVFGGVPRARVSSQCWKRAIRTNAFENAPEYFAGKRGHYHSEPLAKKLEELGIDKETANNLAAEAFTALTRGGKTKEKKTKNKADDTSADLVKKRKSNVILYLSPMEIDSIAYTIKSSLQESADKSTPKKKNQNESIIDKGKVAEAIKKATHRDFADIALFGRMVADDHSLMLEGAAMFSHAISTHEAANEVDFFSAVDDTKPTDSAGAGHIGTLEMNSACYYRYIGLNLDLLFDDDHLAKLEEADRKAILAVFLRSVLESVPGARKNSMFGFTLPQYVLGLVRKGQPLSLVNAFETPVKPQKAGGYIKPSIDELEKHWDTLKKQYGLDTPEQLKGSFNLSVDTPMNQWIDNIVTAALEG